MILRWMCAGLVLASALSTCAADEPVPIQVDIAVGKGLAYLARQQQGDGAFTVAEEGGPRLQTTALATLAMLSSGQVSGTGRYGLAVRRGMNFLVRRIPDDGNAMRSEGCGIAGQAQIAMALSAAYGAADDPGERVMLRPTLEAILNVIVRAQQRNDPTRGGWNADGKANDPDLISTAWCVLALRAIKDAGFSVPKDALPRAAAYAIASYKPDQHQFFDRTGAGSPATAAAVLICLEPMSNTGNNIGPPEAAMTRLTTDAMKIIVDRKLSNEMADPYSAWYMMNLAAQESVDSNTPAAVRSARDAVLTREADDGGWPPPRSTAPLGGAAATSLAVLALTPPYHFLPFYRR